MCAGGDAIAEDFTGEVFLRAIAEISISGSSALRKKINGPHKRSVYLVIRNNSYINARLHLYNLIGSLLIWCCCRYRWYCRYWCCGCCWWWGRRRSDLGKRLIHQIAYSVWLTKRLVFRQRTDNCGVTKFWTRPHFAYELGVIRSHGV